MKSNKSWLGVLAAVAALASAQTGRAITFGEPDGNLHPNVGEIVVDAPGYPRMLNPSGTLVYKGKNSHGKWVGVFLTAGHVTVYLEADVAAGYYTLDRVKVNFNPDPMTHPEQDIPSVGIHTFLVARPNYCDSDDVGILVIEAKKASDLPEPAVLAPVGFLDQFSQSELHESELVAVGYGVSLLFPPPELDRESLGHRQFSTPQYLNLVARCISLQVNGPAGNSGIAPGDSGGPLFWINPQTGAKCIVGIARGGDGQYNSVSYHYRADTQLVRDFIQEVIDGL
jgi:hypothetical protein